MKEAWHGQYQSFNEALKYMLDRQSGKEKMTPNQFLILYGIKKSLSLPLPDNKSDVQQLKSLGFIEQDGSLSIKANKVLTCFHIHIIIISVCIDIHACCIYNFIPTKVIVFKEPSK